MSLPIVIIFERHWDTIPKHLTKNCLPDLVKQGYSTLAFEVPENLTSAEIVDRYNSSLEIDSNLNDQAEKLLKQVGITKKLSNMSLGALAQLMRLYVSSKQYMTVAENIKHANCILKDTFDIAASLAVSVKGVDIGNIAWDEIVSSDISKKSG